MLALLVKYYGQPDSPNKLAPIEDVKDIFWGIEETATRPPNPNNPSDVGLLFGWMNKACGVCGSEEVKLWSQDDGYRCGAHLFNLHRLDMPTSELGGYTGAIDGSGAYEHGWVSP